jgi:hypothetical protein
MRSASPASLSLRDDQSAHVVASEIEAARTVEHGSEKDDNNKEQRGSEAKGDSNFTERRRFGLGHGLTDRLSPDSEGDPNSQSIFSVFHF